MKEFEVEVSLVVSGHDEHSVTQELLYRLSTLPGVECPSIFCITDITENL